MEFKTDLDIIKEAGFTVNRSFWGLVAPEIMTHVAMQICDQPEDYSLKIVNWAIDVLEWPKREWR